METLSKQNNAPTDNFQVGSSKALEEPALPGSGFKIIDGEQRFDDGEVA